MKKRLIALLLAGAMCFSNTISFAAEEEGQVPDPVVQEEVVPEDTVKTEEGEKPEEMVTTPGWNFTKEGWYYYDNDNNLVTGWLKLGSTWYYLDGANETYPGLMVSNTRKMINGAEYWFTSSGSMRTGWIQEGKNWYYARSSGALEIGWAKINGTWYFFDQSNAEYPKVMLADGRKTIGNRDYWFTSSGSMRTGWIQDKDQWYHANSSGALEIGWANINGTWYFFDQADEEHPYSMATNRSIVVGGSEYKLDKEGHVITGWIQEEDNKFYAESAGNFVEGWKYINGYWYFFDKDSEIRPRAMVKNCRKMIDGKEYWFSPSGAMYVGWILKEGKWYYANSSGALETNWAQVKGTWYFFDHKNEEYPRAMLANCRREIGDKEYWFDSSGALLKGWIKDKEDWYYANGSGELVTGWAQVNGAWYFFEAADAEKPRVMIHDCIREINGHEFRFGSSGAMKTGWLFEDPDWYYISSSGYKESGWLEVGGVWYYLDGKNDNKMVKNSWKYINNSWYYFKDSGAMAKGWLELDGEWYYMNASGVMETGWVSVGGVWYYMYSNGAMAKSTTIDGYKISSTGAMVSYGPVDMYNRIYWRSSPTAYFIAVDRNTRQVGIYKGGQNDWTNIATWSCTIGAPSTPTITGSYHVGSKGYYFDSKDGFRCYYYTQISGDYLFHSVLYHKNGSLADGRLGMALSHGCVRMHINHAKWIYDNIPRNTAIYIY